MTIIQLAEQVITEDPSIFTNKWVLALYGWVLYQIYATIRAKKDIDTNLDGLISLKEMRFYIQKEFLSLLFSAWIVPAGVMNAEWSWTVFIGAAGVDWEFGNHVYIIMGCMAAIVQFVITKIF